MKKCVTTLLSFCLFICSMSAQQNKDENDIVNTKGSSLINLYYGPMLGKGIYRLAAPDNSFDLSIKSIGPIGFVYEYLIMEEMGIGLEAGYSELIMTYKETAANSSNGRLEDFTQEVKFTNTRIMLRAAYHFVEDKHMDLYGFVSAGYKGRRLTFTSNDPSGGLNFTAPLFIPFGIKPGFGARYYFIKNVGINAEVALGTPIICGGLCFKF